MKEWSAKIRQGKLDERCWSDPTLPLYDGAYGYYHDNVITFLCYYCGVKIARCTAEALDKILSTEKGKVVLHCRPNDPHRLYCSECVFVAHVAGELKR